MKNKYIVYMIENLVNHKKYIGITKRNPKIRFREHFSNQKELLFKAKEKYGIKNFSFIIIEENISEDEVSQKEKDYIIKYNTLIPNGYNLSKGGITNKSISEKGKQRLRQCNLGINNPRCSKKILMIDKQSNKIIQTFGSAREAGRFLGNENKYRAILNCLSGKQTTSLGYIWKYEY